MRVAQKEDFKCAFSSSFGVWTMVVFDRIDTFISVKKKKNLQTQERWRFITTFRLNRFELIWRPFVSRGDERVRCATLSKRLEVKSEDEQASGRSRRAGGGGRAERLHPPQRSPTRSFLGCSRTEETDSVPRKEILNSQGIKDTAACSAALRATLLRKLRFGTSGQGRGRCNSRGWAHNNQLQRDKSHVRHDQELVVWKHGEDGI